MVSVFVLQHVHAGHDGAEDVKFIGAFTSRDKAEAAIVRLGLQPGFVDEQDGFHVDGYRVDQDHWTEGYVTEATERSQKAQASPIQTLQPTAGA